jgi:hypothetical protein
MMQTARWRGRLALGAKVLGRRKGKIGYGGREARGAGALVESGSTYKLRALYRSRAQSRLQFTLRLTRGTNNQSPRGGWYL